jgi:hypothetical protein
MLHAAADSAQMNMTTQSLVVPGTVTVSGDKGLSGTMQAVTADLPHEVLRADGPIAMRFGDRMSLTARSLVRDGTDRTWTFEGADVTLSYTPGEEAAGVPLP